MGAKRFSAREFLRLLDLWQIPYHVNPGWSEHNHDDRQSPLDLEMLVVHHTGDDAPDDADLRVLWWGRSDLPGPLCTGGIRDDGTLELVSWGTSYHAGPGAANVLAAVRNGYSANPPSPGPDSINGNRISMGWETMYSGKQAPTGAATDTLIRLNAAICWRLGWPATRVIGHREWTSRKPDPGSLNMATLRSRIQKAINDAPPRKVAEETGDEMGDREVLTYDGKAYERRGFLVRHIKTSDELHELIDPAPKGEGIPSRASNVAELSELVNLDTLARIATDARTASSKALELAQSFASANATLVSQVDELRDQINDLRELLIQTPPATPPAPQG